MSYPDDGFIKIYPDNVTIVGGDWALNSDASPQPVRTPATLDAYYDARVTNLATAPCLRKAEEVPALSGVYVPFVNSGYELSFSPSSIGIEFFNGSYPSVPVATVDFLSADFPTGMVINQLSVYFTGQLLFGSNRNRFIDSIKFNYFGSNFYTYTPGITGLLTGSVNSPVTGAGSIIPTVLTTWSIVKVMKQFGLTIPVPADVDANLGIPRCVISECFLLGVYNTQLFQFTNLTPNVLPGQYASLIDPQTRLETFDPDEFKIYWDTLEGEEDVNPFFPGWTGGIRIPRKYILELTAGVFRFIMPYGPPFGGRRLMLTGTANSFSFSGEFPLQNYNIELVDGSGLYKLVEDQAYDTYYDRGLTPPETIDLKIPDPFAKTGFFHE